MKSLIKKIALGLLLFTYSSSLYGICVESTSCEKVIATKYTILGIKILKEYRELIKEQEHLIQVEEKILEEMVLNVELMSLVVKFEAERVALLQRSSHLISKDMEIEHNNAKFILYKEYE